MLIGIDEAGMGTLAGPMVAAVVALPEDLRIPGVKDSKRLTHKMQYELAEQIISQCPFYLVTDYAAAEIDHLGLSMCWQRAITFLALSAHAKYPTDVIVLDGNRLIGLDYVQSIVKADATHPAVSAASILAKYLQCLGMDHFQEQYPQYGFGIHRGYPTAAHRQALEEYGPCPIHRMSFSLSKSSKPSGSKR
jgi:ribonuclease HII